MSEGSNVPVVAADVWANPSQFPLRIDPAADKVVFVQLSADQYRDLAFLDDRYISTANSWETSISELVGSESGESPRGRPVHAIFHIAFCGSTFVARCLGRLPGALVLKEPFPLHDLAYLKRHPSMTAARCSDWKRTFELLMTLLSRTYATDDVAIVKPTDASTPLIADVLGHSDASAALFLHVELDEFLPAVLRDQTRRGFVRQRLDDLSVLYPDHPLFQSTAHAALTDGERAGCLWLLHRQLYADFVARAPDARVRSLDFAVFLRNPSGALESIARLFGLHAERKQCDSAVAAEAVTHSKDRDTPFRAADRREALRAVAGQHGDEIAGARAWVEQNRTSHGLSETLPFPLEVRP